MDKDFTQIFSQYNREYNYCFQKHYEKLPYMEFLTNMYNLGGNVKEIIRYRAILVGKSEGTKEERKHAFKYFMTDEIREYRKIKESRKAEQRAIKEFEMVNKMAMKKKKNSVKKYEELRRDK